MSKSLRKILAILAVVICVVLAVLLVVLFFGRKEQDSVKVGFIMSGDRNETGWNGMHYIGVKQAAAELGVELVVEEKVEEFSGECGRAIDRLAEDGVDVILLSSYGYSEEVRQLVKEMPEIAFYVNSSEYHDINMSSYFARMYQARYLSGIVAGMKTESGKIGYVAAMANNEVNRGINAFTLGVRRVNPNAEVMVMWTENWDDAEKETEAAKYLIEQGADVLTYHQNQPNVIKAAEEAGIYSIGYHEALEGYSEKYLTSVVCDWELVYEEILREFLIGQGNTRENYWIGLEAGVVTLSAYSDEVTLEIQEEVDKAKTEIMSGKDVFSGIIYDTEGQLRCEEKEMISDEVLLERFDWYVEGVRIYER